MDKKKIVALVLPGLLLAPTLLAHQVLADEMQSASSQTSSSLQLQSGEEKQDTAVLTVTETAQTAAQGTAQEGAAQSDSQVGSVSFSEGQGRAAAEQQAASQPVFEAAAADLGSQSAKHPAEPQPESPSADPSARVSPAPQLHATGADLAAYTGPLSDSSLSGQELTVQDAVTELLKWAALHPSQIGQTPSDYLSFAKSLGMIDEAADPTAKVQDLQSMYTVAQRLHDAYRAEKKEPLFLNGRAQPIFPFTSGAMTEGYSYEDSDIVRYIVYVETDYDTDGDGKRDLIKTFVQVPKAAVNGDYKAATIYEASPYVTGTTEKQVLEDFGLQEGGSFNLDDLHSQPDKRVPVGSMTTIEAAKKSRSSDWYYINPLESTESRTHYDYENLNWYNYYLVRGYAVVTSSGNGSKGSDGFNTTGSDVEIAAYRSVIEWLNGQRTAYTDKTSNIAIKADWSNGNVAMNGLSWAGTTTFGVGTTGVDGLKTIVPAAGIASWYDYYNSQGTSIRYAPADLLSWLSVYVSGRVLDQDDWDTIKERYAAFVTELNKEQRKDGSNYSDLWANRDYTLNAEQIKVPALIVHGLNDHNVRTKHFELMQQAMEKSGQTYKLLLHQGNHTEPATARFGTNVNGRPFDDLLNRWYSHYLYGLDNGVETIPTVQVQNNYDPTKWTEYESWKAPHQLDGQAYSKREEVTISSDLIASPVGWRDRDSSASRQSSDITAAYAADVEEDVTIKGNIPLRFRARLNKGSGKDFQINAFLMDVSEEDYPVVAEIDSFDQDGNRNTNLAMDQLSQAGYWMGSNLTSIPEYIFGARNVKYNIIASGWINLANPEAGYDSASSRSSIDPTDGRFRDYTVYLQPNVYTVKKGHKLVLALNAYDPTNVYIPDIYEITFKNDSVRLTIPTVEYSKALRFNYLPNEQDSDYAGLPDRAVDGGAVTQPDIEDKDMDMDERERAAQEIKDNFADPMSFRRQQKEWEEKSQETLPDTGSKENAGLLAAAGLSLLTALGLKKTGKKED
ncbi:Xaa-Pro dipeptidyl-peptidase [Streptococcus sp. DD11]|uniref:CocE/NonD family hydrolase n=1 Tax=Streptococcus sp. DD11 TaxID=1777879 RepID=UPI0007926B2E|nr:CocE/NonD family hydrolase [Streptococcus sp. DD11]KXT83608.1 Xaa-Pro dipeptidyl-peptidase [Streptococcus sp. DD11]